MTVNSVDGKHTYKLVGCFYQVKKGEYEVNLSAYQITCNFYMNNKGYVPLQT